MSFRPDNGPKCQTSIFSFLNEALVCVQRTSIFLPLLFSSPSPLAHPVSPSLPLSPTPPPPPSLSLSFPLWLSLCACHNKRDRELFFKAVAKRKDSGRQVAGRTGWSGRGGEEAEWERERGRVEWERERGMLEWKGNSLSLGGKIVEWACEKTKFRGVKLGHKCRLLGIVFNNEHRRRKKEKKKHCSLPYERNGNLTAGVGCDWPLLARLRLFFL